MSAAETLAGDFLALTDTEDWAARETLFHEDAEFVVPMAVLQGPAATTAFSRSFVGAFSGARHTVTLLVSSGDVAVVEGVWRGTHTGPLVTPAGEVPPTGNAVDLPFACVVQADSGRIRSVRIYFDQLAFLGQLGLVPQAAHA